MPKKTTETGKPVGAARAEKEAAPRADSPEGFQLTSPDLAKDELLRSLDEQCEKAADARRRADERLAKWERLRILAREVRGRQE